jgi:transposase InsO family protein
MIISGRSAIMPWKEISTVSLRYQFVQQALQENLNMSELCREFEISRKTGYKWLQRYREEGKHGLKDRSRRPHTSPNQTPHEVEQRVLRARDEHPAWGGRKIHRWLKAQKEGVVPPPSTITEILRRNGRIDPEESRKRGPWKRFKAERPNQMWQMDFKGHFPMKDGERCHPLTLLDDHSRYCIGLQACGNERRETVKNKLTGIFRRYGLPQQLLVDNGPPWGTTYHPGRLSHLGVWLIRLGIRLIHTRTYHPQTIGKEERFHRTLGEEVLRYQSIQNLEHAQRCFDPWRQVYNHERPHEAIGMEAPATRYEKSTQLFPETLPPIMYDQGEMVRKVDMAGRISFKNQPFRVGKALYGHPVADRPIDVDGRFDVFFCAHKVRTIEVRSAL